MTAKPTTTRTPRSPRQRAEEALGVADRLVTKLTDKETRLDTEVQANAVELAAAIKRRDYLAQSPDLEQPAAPATGTRPPVDPPKPDHQPKA